MKLYAKIFFLFITFNLSYSQSKVEIAKTDSLYNCEKKISQNNLLLNKQKFASVTPILLQVQNENQEFGAFQIGKRKNKLYLYFKILVSNTCLKNKEAIELHFDNGKIIILKNDYPINCEGNFVKALNNKDLNTILDNKIKIIKLYTFKKDYYFSLKDTEYTEIVQGIKCLQNYKIND
ncbi:hypothetical protein [uncultured Flavobacterium sp.]|uniref:hypothetical protein n=1 Tax=uncultured Flavobacterium sp. TaxID=165435 RepID=UPI0025ED57D0|nr:hypothetical protein [uncultured Flavobacterium sp.]